jgi:hypothetical protein
MICVTYDVRVFTYDRNVSFDILEPSAGARSSPGKTQQCNCKFSCRVVCRPASRITPSRRGPQNLATGSDFRCYPRGIKRVRGKASRLCATPAAVHPTGQLKPVGLRQAKALSTHRNGMALAVCLAVVQYSRSMKNPQRPSNEEHFQCSTAAAVTTASPQFSA